MKRRHILMAFGILAAVSLAQSPDPFDPDLSAKATVVLRVQWLEDGDADKYEWQEVRVLHVLKNDSKHTFTNTVVIAHYSGANGIPRGICTVYLERYNPEGEDRWKLMGGSAKTGVSHAEQPSASQASEASGAVLAPPTQR